VEVKGAVHSPPTVAFAEEAATRTTFTPDTSPPVAVMCVSTWTRSPAFAAVETGSTPTVSVPGAGDAGDESEGVGEGESSAEADAPPAARIAATPSPTKIGFTAGRQYTAPAPPSHRL
jgi:hypothetical protein